MLVPLLASVLFPALALAAPISIGISFSPASNTLPTLTLPYATYQATYYDKEDDYYTWKNIRFAAPPVGNLRFQKPAPPLQELGVQDGKTGFQCFQATSGEFSIALPILEALGPSSEDCLFLDVQVPGKVVRSPSSYKLPVLVWIYGGGYALGAKDFILYDGSPYLARSDNNLIYVAPNYRLGAFGWMAGKTMEAQGAPNAGLWDQRAALQWVRDYIGLLGGDNTQVTVMGESAGGGSIMHHLVGEGGTSDPLFQKAILQSPAFYPQYDRAGYLDRQYRAFANEVGCSGDDITCLQSKPTEVLHAANTKLIKNAPYGTFNYGPAVDGSYIRDLPGVEMLNGHYVKGIKVLTSHMSAEGALFSDTSIQSNSAYRNFLTSNFADASPTVVDTIESLYPDPGLFSKYKTQFDRLQSTVGEAVIACNCRYIAKAYAGNVWNFQVSVPPGIHAEDMILAFWRTNLDLGALNINIDIPFLSSFNLAIGYQSYLTSFVRSGDPNVYRELHPNFPRTISWPKSVVGTNVGNVLDVNLLGFRLIDDGENSKQRCDFWQSAPYRP